MSQQILKNRAYDAIKRLILSGELRPGQRLAERDLGARLRVSRTPVREALGRLAQEGLLESRPQRGHTVRAVDARLVEDLYDLREVLESYAIRLAVRRLTAADAAALAQLAARLATYDSEETQGEAELRQAHRVHESIVRAARNQPLAETLTRLYERLQMFVWIDALYADEASLTRREHQAIIAALIARDEKRLLRLMQEHLRRSKKNVLRALKARSALAL